MIIVNSGLAMIRNKEIVGHEDFGLTKKNSEKPYSVTAF
jgi:hypothetical protein